MFSYFFAYQTELPDGCGFSLFDGTHLFFLALSALSVLLLYIFFHYQTISRKKLILNRIVILALILTAMQDLILTVTHHMDIGMLPLHLCDLAVFCYLLHRISRLPVLGYAAVCVFLPGALSALLFPDWTMYPLLNYMNLHGFIYHTLIVAYPILLLTDKSIWPRLRNFPKTAAFLLSLAIPVYLFDRSFRCNYMFLLYPPKGSPLTFFSRFGADTFRTSGYTIAYMSAVALLLLLIFLGFEIIWRVKRHLVLLFQRKFH